MAKSSSTKKVDMCRRVRDRLSLEGVRKAVNVPKRRFYISDDCGNQAVFHIKETDKTVGYKLEDVEVIIDAFLDELIECIRRGEKVTLTGFGSFFLKLHQSRVVRPGFLEGGETIEVPAFYKLKFLPGTPLKAAVEDYENSVKELEGSLQERS